MNDLRQCTNDLRESTQRLAEITDTQDIEYLRQLAFEAELAKAKAARRELTKPRARQ
jgi:hypothetical protein